MKALRKHWKLAMIAVFSLSLAMALGVIALSASNTFLLLQPAAPEPDRLVMIYSSSPEEAVSQVSYPDYQYLREHNHVFIDIAAAPNTISLLYDENSGRQGIRVFSRPVTDNYLNVMGIRPFLGRMLAPGDDRDTSLPAVMTNSCWTRLGSDPHIIGRKIGTFTIVGVAPKEFTGAFYGFNGDLLVPLGQQDYTDQWREKHDARRLFLLGRLKPGVTRAQAQAEVSALFGQLAASFPKEEANRKLVVGRATLLPPGSMANAELILGILLAAVVLVLLIACANVANLLLAIAVGRRHEAMIKLALGAPRGQLIREFLRESSLLCLASGALGFGVAAAVIHRYSTISFALPIYGEFSLALNLRLDATVLAFALALLLIAILATGLAPALYASSPSVSQVLSGEIVVGGTGKRVRRNALVVVQVAVSTVVLVGMGLCQRSLYNLRHADPGFSARNLAAMQVAREVDSAVPQRQLQRNLAQAVAAIPGVESVALAENLPLFGGTPEPVELGQNGQKIAVEHNVVDSDYFATLGVPVLSGRVFNSFDREKTPEVAVINRKMADQFWPGADPLGKTIAVGDPARKITIVGIVGDGKYEDLDETPQPYMYYALSQHDQAIVYVVARTKSDPTQFLKPITQASLSVGLQVPLAPFTYENWINLMLILQRIIATCATGLSALGMLLAVIGLFGAVSYSVSERKKELGIRVALGARPAQLLQMVLKQTLRIAGAGVVIGIALGVGATVLLESQFYQIGTVEWSVLIPVSLGMLAVAAVVAYLSARPWLRINPMEAVRHS